MFKKQKALLLIVCLLCTIFGCKTGTKPKDRNSDINTDKTVVAKNIEVDSDKNTDKNYQHLLTVLEKEAVKNNGLLFNDTDVPATELLISNQLYLIVNSELDKPIHLRDYGFVLWYINKYLTDNNTTLKDNYSSYIELKEGIEKTFPKLYNFNTQSDMTNISYVETGFNRLLLEYYEYKYFLSLTKEQQIVIKKEYIAWQEYKSAAMKYFTAFHVVDGGSIAGIFRADYLGTLDEQYLSTVLGCSFENNVNDSDIDRNIGSSKNIKLDYTFIDTFPKYLEKVYSNKSTKSAITYSYSSKENFEELLELSNAEITAWNKWIDIRNSYSANGFDSKDCNYEYFTDMLKRTKLIDMKNLYFNHSYPESSVEEILLKPDSSVEEIVNYDFIKSYK